MAAKVLTATFLEGLKPPASGRTEIADLKCSGLSFRITRAGARSWSFRFRDPETGSTTRASVGVFPDVGLGAARDRADKMRKQVAAGVNPTKLKRDAIADAAKRTFGALAERFMAEHAKRHKRPRSIAGDRQNLDNYVLPKWKGRPYASIKRADAIELIEGLISAGTPVVANRVHSLVSTIFSFAVDSGLLETHPVARMKKRGVETPSDRVLTDGEVRLFWLRILEPPVGRQTGLALRLALLTAVRRSEAAGICRAELSNLDTPSSALWTIPGQRTKNGRPLILPLSALAVETVKSMLAGIPDDQQFLLPTRSRKRSGPMSGDTLTRAMGNFSKELDTEAVQGVDREAVASWSAHPPSPHDLRRTVETRMAALGVPKDIRDKVLNHVSADVGSVHYDRHSYLPEKRAALAKWEDAIARIMKIPAGGAHVVPLHRVAEA